MRIVFVGGGTGGHFYPLIAVAEALRENDSKNGSKTELYYFGPDPYNQVALDSVSMKFSRVPAGKSRVGYGRFLNFLDLFKTLFGVMSAFLKLLLLYPDAVMSKGGYTSVPVIIAAKFLRIPIIVHESDAVPGRANLFAAKSAAYVGVAYSEAASYFPAEKVAVVGMPIRSSFFKKVSDPYSTLGIPKDRPVILVTGGSSGADRLNDFILSSLSRLLPSFTIVHQVGDKNYDKVSSTALTLFTDSDQLSHYFVFGHLSQADFAAALQSASLVITRAGSTTLFEVATSGKPSIVIPIPEEISRDQRSNAYSFSRQTKAVVLEEHNLSDDILVAEIERIFGDVAVQKEMVEGALSLTANNAAYTLANALYTIGKEHE